MTTGIALHWLGRVAYAPVLEAMRAHREGILAGEADEVVWLLEHEPVVTLGRRGGEVDPARLASTGTEVVATERGGLATWHGPGQLVGYLLIDLGARRWAVRSAVDGVEQGLIRWLASVGIEGRTEADAHGVWVGDAKIAAVGLHVRRGVTMHGFALNLQPDLTAFDAITPCGLRAPVTSVAACGGPSIAAEDAAFRVAEHVVDAIVRAHA